MANVTHLTVRGFKSISALERFELRSLNVLIGPNGAGKSNLFDLFRMLAAMAHRHLQKFVAQEGDPDALFHRGRKHTAEMEIECAWGEQVYAASLAAVGANLAFAREQTRYASATQWITSGHCESELGSAGSVEANPDARFLHKAMSECRVYHFHDRAISSGLRQAQPVEDNPQLHANGSNLVPFLRHLKERHPHNYRRILETVRLAAPYISDFLFREEADERIVLGWRERGVEPERICGPRQLSLGTIRFICLATLLLQPVFMQPPTILIDGPELGLHPCALVLLAELFKAAAESRQVVASTQSVDLVSEFEPQDIITVGRRDGQSVFERPDEDQLQEWLEECSLGELWRMNVVGDGPSR